MPYGGDAIETWKIAVTTPGGTSKNLDFIYGPPARVLSILPSTVTAGLFVLVSGTGFNEIVKINLIYGGGVYRELTYTIQEKNNLKVEIPQDIPSGEYGLQVVTEYGDGIYKNFEVVKN